MNTVKPGRWKPLVLIAAFAGAAYAATAFAGPTVLDWSEEVELHDGKIIVIKRHDEVGRFGFPLAHRGGRKYWQFCYAPMGIHWKSKPDYFPDVFDIVDGKAYVLVPIGSHELCMLHGYPETNALYFVWENGAWKKIPYEEFPKGLRSNLLGNTHYDDDGSRDVRGLVTLAEKETRSPTASWLKKKHPDIYARQRTLNEHPAFRDACKKAKSVHGQTDNTPEVFLPATRKDCN